MRPIAVIQTTAGAATASKVQRTFARAGRLPIRRSVVFLQGPLLISQVIFGQSFPSSGQCRRVAHAARAPPGPAVDRTGQHSSFLLLLVRRCIRSPCQESSRCALGTTSVKRAPIQGPLAEDIAGSLKCATARCLSGIHGFEKSGHVARRITPNASGIRTRGFSRPGSRSIRLNFRHFCRRT